MQRYFFSNFRMRLKKLPTTKFFFDKKHYSKEDFSATLRSLNWAYLYCLDNAYHKLEFFNSIMTLALKTNAPMKRVFIRNDKKTQELQSDSLVKIFIRIVHFLKRKMENPIETQ